jgi:hypothetical protein
MRMHLDAELIQACLDDWRNGKLNPLQVAEFFAKHALPTQSESLNADEGKLMIERVLHRFLDLVRATGLISDEVLGAAYDEAIKGLSA